MLLFLSLIPLFTNAGKLLLTPKSSNNAMLLSSFNQEHNIENVVTINNLKIYKTDSETYNKYSKTVNELYEVEEEQEYRVSYIKNRPWVLPNDLPWAGTETPWHLTRIMQRNLPLNASRSVPNKCLTNTEVEIETIVVDTGVDYHKDFATQPELLVNYGGDGKDYDCNSHGTHCIGLVGSSTYGVCKDAKLYAVKVLNCEGSGSTSGVISGMEYVYNRHKSGGARRRTIMSMSLGGGYSGMMNRVVEEMLRGKGIYIVVAAGNENSDIKGVSPASAKGVIAVMASDRSDNRAYFSNYGLGGSVYSPGVEIRSTVLNNKIGIYSGTSMSTPIMAGIMNHYINKNPDLSMKGLREAIEELGTKDKIKNNKENTKNVLGYIG